MCVFERRRLLCTDVAVVARVPVTSVARTLVDLADILVPERLSHALSEAERRLAVDAAELRSVAAALAHRRGRGPARLRAVVRRHQLPEPQLNAWIEGVEVDAVWREMRLAVECDGWEFHRGRRAFQRDRDKANALQLRGWRVLRFTHADVVHRPDRVAAAVRAAID
jgi:very-short-patch-repair endonuclease